LDTCRADKPSDWPTEGNSPTSAVNALELPIDLIGSRQDDTRLASAQQLAPLAG